MSAKYSEEITKDCTYYCKGCDLFTDKLYDDHCVDLCYECNDKYYDSTGYCSLSCSLGNGCDQTC